MACFAINKVKLHRHHLDNKDALFIKYAGFSLPDGAMVALEQDDVSISIDGRVYDFPAGSFEWKGDQMHYISKSAPGTKPQIQASIDLEKSKWSLKLIHINSGFVDNSDGVDIALSIGDYQGSENVYLESKNQHDNMLMYKRKPKISCATRNHRDEDDQSDDNHRHESNHKDKDKDDGDHESKASKHRDQDNNRSDDRREN